MNTLNSGAVVTWVKPMAVLFIISVEAADTVLAETFDRLDDVQFEMENAVTTPSGQEWPCLWITGHSKKEIESALRDDPDVDGFEHITSEDDRVLYHFSATDGAVEFRDIIQAENGTILAATGEQGEWKVDIRCRKQEDVSRIHDRLWEEGIPPEIHQICQVGGSGGTTLLTEQQRKAFEIALEHGYFKIPREASLEEIADEMGISHQAASERLRRGYESLAEAETGRPSDLSSEENRPA